MTRRTLPALAFLCVLSIGSMPGRAAPPAACAGSSPQQSFAQALAHALTVRRALPDHLAFTANLQVRLGSLEQTGTLWGDLAGSRLRLTVKWPPLPLLSRVYAVPADADESGWEAVAAGSSGDDCRLALRRDGGPRAVIWLNERAQPLRAESERGAWVIAAEFSYARPDGRPLSLLPVAAEVRVNPLGLDVRVRVTDIWFDRSPPGMPPG